MVDHRYGAFADRLVGRGGIVWCNRRCGLHADLSRAARALTKTSSELSTPVRTGSSCRWVIRSKKRNWPSPPRSIPRQANRSIGGGLHAMNFEATAGDYFKHANDEILVILQTESPEGVENAEAIYSLPGVDAIFVGPNDLTFQMRGPDGIDPTPDQLEAMLQRVLAAGKKTGTP